MGKNFLKIKGDSPLNGTVITQGAKNVVLPIMAACILIKGKVILKSCPAITDVFFMKKLLQSIGCKVMECIELDGSRTIAIDATELFDYKLPEEYVECMRSSIIMLGPLLSRMQEAQLMQPGGCTIGSRPLDLHFLALRKLGAEIEEENGRIHAVCKRAEATKIVFPKVSVGATENAILLAVLANGRTELVNASGEPEISELCEFLNKAGADIQIVRKDEQFQILIQGKECLNPVIYNIPSDRIVAGTYAFACIATGGKVQIERAPLGYMEQTIEVIKKLGAQISVKKENANVGTLIIEMDKRPTAVGYIETSVYPGFPTDMQSVLLAVSCIASGKTIIYERIFENRFKVFSELLRMGADINLMQKENHQMVEILGVKKLYGCNVLAKELRGGAALVIAGLSARGITTVGNIHYIQRGYEDIERDLKQLNANVSLADACEEV